jgi:hypothetical protein
MESSEHVVVGDSITLSLLDGTTVPAAATPLPVGDRTLSYGRIVALGGDFYGVRGKAATTTTAAVQPYQPISSATDPGAAFALAYGSLANAPDAELARILQVMAKEQAAIDNRPEGTKPSDAFAVLGDSLSYEWNEITGGGPASRGKASVVLQPGRYITLATVNMDHFGTDAVKAYLAGHLLALRSAAQLHQMDPKSPQARMKLLQAYGFNAFADHFLSDLFAAGHIRTPRRPLYEISGTIAGETGMIARAMHNEDNKDGLHVRNARGDRWVAYGDGFVLDDASRDNRVMAIAAVQASADEVYRAAATGQAAVAQPAALQLTPVLEDFVAKPGPGGPDHPPLFWADAKHYVYRRGGLAGDWHDTSNYDFFWPFSVAKMAADVALGRP